MIVKRILIHIIALFMLMTNLVSCVFSHFEQEESVNRISIEVDMLMPLSELPATKAISDDTAINDYAIWVFSNEKFVEAIYSTDTYVEDGVTHYMVNLNDDGSMFILLPEGLENVTLAMVANVTDIKSQVPVEGTSIDEANADFAYNVTSMPMYGRNSNVFNVAPGADGGVIILRRAMARIEVDAVKASDHFTLQQLYVYYPNNNGTVQELATITNESNTGTLSGTVSDNTAYVYVPEINLSSQTSAISCIILEGLYKGKKTYYKLDFIAQKTNEEGDIEYFHLNEITRNYRYIFDIQYLTEGTGYSNLTDALDNDASNIIPDGNINLIWIDDINIKDITTNNYIYLGVTSSQLYTSEGLEYHVANVSIVTNSEKGWKFEQPLPEGVYLSIEEFIPQNGVEVVSVWVYLDKTVYNTGDSVVIYVYGENIRKSLTITVG